MQINLRHKGKYTGDEFTIDEVIASLAAQKEIINAGVEFLAEIDPDFSLEGTKIRVESISKGTLGWDFLVEVYGEYQKQIEEKVVGSLEEMFGADIPEEWEGFATLAALAVTYIVMRYAYERVMRSKGENAPSVHIKGEGNVVIQQIAEVISVDPTVIESALERSLPPRKRRRLITKVADFLRPSKKDSEAKIELENAPDISRSALQEFPSDSELEAVNDSRNIDVEGAILNIRGTDRDKRKQGWHATIEGDDRFPKRLPMDLYPTVNPNDLADKQIVKADLVVECIDGEKGLQPKRIHLLSFVEGDANDFTEESPRDGKD